MKYFFLSLVLFLHTGQIYAYEVVNSWHNHNDVVETALNFARSQIPTEVTIHTIEAASLDPRLKLKQCDDSLTAVQHAGFKIGENMLVGVKCEFPQWTVYINVKASMTTRMIVSKAPIRSGEILTPDNVNFTEMPVRYLEPGYIREFHEIEGLEAARSIPANRVIDSNMLKQPTLVKKKEQVLIFASSGNVKVRMQGMALSDGHYNDKIKVRNLSSNKIIEALVVERGVVNVTF